jgi:hypothetical protein
MRHSSLIAPPQPGFTLDLQHFSHMSSLITTLLVYPLKWVYFKPCLTHVAFSTGGNTLVRKVSQPMTILWFSNSLACWPHLPHAYSMELITDCSDLGCIICYQMHPSLGRADVLSSTSFFQSHKLQRVLFLTTFTRLEDDMLNFKTSPSSPYGSLTTRDNADFHKW